VAFRVNEKRPYQTRPPPHSDSRSAGGAHGGRRPRLGRGEQGLRRAALRRAAAAAVPHDLGQRVPAEPRREPADRSRLIDLEEQLRAWRIDRAGLVDLALLVGTDFNDGVRGIGPKKALKLVQQHGRIEAMPTEIREALGDVDEVRRIYLQPAVTDE
jgi:hypothetical protein